MMRLFRLLSRVMAQQVHIHTNVDIASKSSMEREV